MRRDAVTLTPRHRAIVYGCCALLFVTGAAWLVAHTWMTVDGEFGAEPHPLERWSLRLHGAGAMLFLVALGSLVRGHMPAGWKTNRSRPSGVTLVATSIILVVSGWCLYYVGNETARALISQIHWGLGLAGPVIIGLHVLGRRRAALKSAAASQSIPASRAQRSRDSLSGRESSSSSRPAASSSQSPACTAN